MHLRTQYFSGLLFGVISLTPTGFFAEITRSFPEIKCECRLFGNYVPVGTRLCMNTPEGARMATCQMMQNNPSWQIEKYQCPVALELSPKSDSFDKLVS